jgi:hypothetical protein
MVLEKPNSFHVAEYGAGGAGLEEPDCWKTSNQET